MAKLSANVMLPSMYTPADDAACIAPEVHHGEACPNAYAETGKLFMGQSVDIPFSCHGIIVTTEREKGNDMFHTNGGSLDGVAGL